MPINYTLKFYHTHGCVHVGKGHRATCRSCFSQSTVWVLVTELRLSGLAARVITPWATPQFRAHREIFNQHSHQDLRWYYERSNLCHNILIMLDLRGSKWTSQVSMEIILSLKTAKNNWYFLEWRAFCLCVIMFVWISPLKLTGKYCVSSNKEWPFWFSW